MKLALKLLFLFFLFSSCLPYKTKLYLPEYVVNNSSKKIFISPYYAINHLSNSIMDSDVDQSVIPVVHSVLSEIIDSLGDKYFDFFSVEENNTIEFIIETDNLSDFCYMDIKTPINRICIQKFDEVVEYIIPKYNLEDYKLSNFIDFSDSEDGSHLHYIILKPKNNKLIIEANSLIQ